MKTNLEPTRTRERGTKVTNPTSPEQRIVALKDIVTNHQYAKIDGMMVDGFTASGIVQVYDALSDANKAKYSALTVDRMATIMWKIVNKQKAA